MFDRPLLAPIKLRLQARTLFLLVGFGVLLLGVVTAWFGRIEFREIVRWDSHQAVFGLVAVIPLMGFYYTNSPLRDVVIRLMGEPLARMSPFDLVLLAALAGIGEELLFRGPLQILLDRWLLGLGWVFANVLFGLLHYVTLRYAIMAGLMGLYLSAVAEYGDRNLLAPMIAHGVYDYIAFQLILREYQNRTAE